MTTYHSLFTALFAVSALDIKHKQVASSVSVKPDAFGRLLASLALVHHVKGRVKEQIQKSTLSRTLASDYCHSFVVSASGNHVFLFEPFSKICTV